MDNIEAMRNFLREKTNKEIVMKYMFIQAMEKFYDDEYLSRMYRIPVSKIKNLYEALDQTERTNLEKMLREQIAEGELDLSKEAVRWHKEGLKSNHDKDTNTINRNKGNGEER